MATVTDIALTEVGAKRRRATSRLRLARWALFALFLIFCAMWPLYMFVIVSMPALLPEFTGNQFLGPFAFAGMAVVVIVGGYLGGTVFAQRKQVALYLRHFRMSGPVRNMASVLRVRFNGQCRLVTLDDSTFQPMDVGRGYKSLRSVTVLAILTIVGLFVAIGVYAQLKFAPTMNLKEFIWLPIQMSLFIVAPLVVGAAWSFTLLLAALVMHFRRVKKRSHLAITDDASLSQVAGSVFELSSNTRKAVFAAPQATVVKVVDALWMAAVDKLTSAVDVVIVDVTKVTGNVLWELEFLKSSYPALPVIHIAEAQTYQPSELPAEVSLLLYTSDRAGVDRLRNNLRNFLDNASKSTHPRDSTAQVLRYAGSRALLYLVVLTCVSWMIFLAALQVEKLGVHK